MWESRWWGWDRIGIKGYVSDIDSKALSVNASDKCRNNTVRVTGSGSVIDVDGRTYYAYDREHPRQEPVSALMADARASHRNRDRDRHRRGRVRTVANRPPRACSRPSPTRSSAPPTTRSCSAARPRDRVATAPAVGRVRRALGCARHRRERACVGDAASGSPIGMRPQPTSAQPIVRGRTRRPSRAATTRRSSLDTPYVPDFVVVKAYASTRRGEPGSGAAIRSRRFSATSSPRPGARSWRRGRASAFSASTRTIYVRHLHRGVLASGTCRRSAAAAALYAPDSLPASWLFRINHTRADGTMNTDVRSSLPHRSARACSTTSSATGSRRRAPSSDLLRSRAVRVRHARRASRSRRRSGPRRPGGSRRGRSASRRPTRSNDSPATSSACAAARWWSDAVAARPQVWIGREFSAPTDGIVSAGPRGQAADRDLDVVGRRRAPERVVAGAEGRRRRGTARRSAGDLAAARRTRTPASTRSAHPPIGAGCARPFPARPSTAGSRRAGKRPTISFDGIHLTVEGLIRCQGVEVETEHGLAKLDDWDAESTAWLRLVGRRPRTTRHRHVGPLRRARVSRGRASPRAPRRS